MITEKKNPHEKKYIGILVDDNMKTNWQMFSEQNGYSTVSKFIRHAVNYFIDSQSKILFLEKLNAIFHNLKEPLTSIKGYIQIFMEQYKEDLSWEALSVIMKIFDQCNLLEKKIINSIEIYDDKKTKCDILIVDDDVFTINFLDNHFSSKGLICKDALLGKDALETLLRTTPKLILLDILLSDIDGFEVCKSIKSNETLKNIPVYFITALPKSEVEKKLIETGADGYFLKPFNLSEFDDLLNKLSLI